MRQRRLVFWLPLTLVLTAAFIWMFALRRIRSTVFDGPVDMGGGRTARVTVTFSRRPSYFQMQHVGSLISFGGYRYELRVAGDAVRPSAEFHVAIFPVAVWEQDGALLVAASGIGTDRAVYRIEPQSGRVEQLHPASGRRPPSWNLLPSSEWAHMDQDFAESGCWN